MGKDEIALYQWFLSLKLEDLPNTPFQLKQAIVVVNSQLWFQSIKQEVEKAIDSSTRTPRQHTGALQADLILLKALTGKIDIF